jgi:putative spermidine/putrescine transport system permease protein
MSRRSAAENGAASRRAPLLLLLPAGLICTVLAVSTLVVLRMSFGERDSEWTSWTLANYRELLQPFYLRILFTTIWLALASAAITVAVAFPVALFIVRTSSDGLRRLVLIAVLLPMLVSVLVQSFGWIALIGPDGLLNRAVAPLSGQPRTFSLLFNRTGVLLGLVQTSIPLAVLPLASALRAIDGSFEEAASVLGASRLQTYRDIILPLSRPGLTAGFILVFGFNVGAFVVPLLLGGVKVTTVAMVIRDQMGPLLNWPLGSALSVILISLATGIQMAHRLVLTTAERGARHG